MIFTRLRNDVDAMVLISICPFSKFDVCMFTSWGNKRTPNESSPSIFLSHSHSFLDHDKSDLYCKRLGIPVSFLPLLRYSPDRPQWPIFICILPAVGFLRNRMPGDADFVHIREESRFRLECVTRLLSSCVWRERVQYGGH